LIERPDPAGTLRSATIAFAVRLLLFVEEIVLARHIVHVETRLADDAIGIVEFLGLG
jgi:hypothetical protein